jgi:hypothetical protein
VAHVTAKNIERLAHLLAMVKKDESVRTELARSGALFGGYHPRMEAVHVANARALSTMIGEGWPTVAEVGEEGQRAAWLIVQHAISLPQFQRQCLALLQAAVTRGKAPAWQVAMLTDRIRILEGRPQLYGTQFDWDANGQMSPLPIEDACRVDERRTQVRLESLAEATARHRREAQESGEQPPADRAEHVASGVAWARQVGWRRD